jgi:hypothetical protein
MDWKLLLGVTLTTREEHELKKQVKKSEFVNLLRNIPDNREKSYYGPIATLLNRLSLICSPRKDGESDRQTKAVVYYVRSENLIPADPFDLQLKPDIVAKLGTRQEVVANIQRAETVHAEDEYKPSKKTVQSGQPTFPECVAAVEIKTDDGTAGSRQIISYVNGIKRNTPQSRMVFGMSARKEGYRFVKMSPCEIDLSLELNWDFDGYKPLLAFNKAILCSIDSHSKELEYSVHNGQTWYITMGQDEEEDICLFPVFSSSGPGRMTWVGIGYVLKEGLLWHRTIKIVWFDVRKSFLETDLYRYVHGQGIIPGLVRLLDRKVLDDDLLSSTSGPDATGENVQRKKEALSLNNIGKPLSQCGSLLEILKVIYDTLESELLFKSTIYI